VLGLPPRALGRVLPPAKAQKLAALLRVGSAAELHPALVSAWDDPDSLVVGGHEPAMAGDADLPPGLENMAERLMFLDTLSTLPDEMLAKVDRASMAVGLEARVPLLDPRVVERAWGLPLDMRIRDGHGKWLLRQVLYRYVPRELVERPKTGFDPPIGAWLRGPLRPWAEDLLDPSRLAREGYLRPDVVGRCWAEHVRGARNWDYRLWGVLMFQAWLARQ
jgi:asparagine synthase (glutamine-hydrolysing)